MLDNFIYFLVLQKLMFEKIVGMIQNLNKCCQFVFGIPTLFWARFLKRPWYGKTFKFLKSEKILFSCAKII